MKIFDTRQDMIQHYAQPGMVIAEVGVFRGEFATTLVDTQPSHIDLIDLWQPNTLICSGNQDGNSVIYIATDTALQEVKNKFATCPNVCIRQGDSSSFLATVDDGSYDLIYLDGDHSYEGVKKDLQQAYKKIKSNGYIMGHDYEMNMSKAQNYYQFGVKQAVDEFCAQYNQCIAAKAMDGCVSFCIEMNKSM